MGKRGPKPIGYSERLQQTISPALAAGVEHAAEVFGVSRTTIVRFAIGTFLQTSGLYPGPVEPLIITDPAKPRTTKRKEEA